MHPVTEIFNKFISEIFFANVDHNSAVDWLAINGIPHFPDKFPRFWTVVN